MEQYNLRYSLSFYDIHLEHPALWDVEIYRYEDNDADGAYPLLASGDPLSIIRGTKSDNKFEPILGSEADITIEITEDIPDEAKPYFSSPITPEAFYTNGETELRVDIKKDGLLFWRGFVKPDFCEYVYTNDRTLFTIVATDRISLLKTQYPDLTAAKILNNNYFLSDILGGEGLYKTEVTDKVKILSSLLSDVSDANTLDGKKAAYQIFQDNNNLPISVYDSIRNINKSFGFRVFYENDFFWIQRVEDMVTENPSVYNSETDTSDTFESFRKDISEIPIFVGGQVRIGAPLREVDFDIDYAFKNLVFNPGWDGFTSGNNGEFQQWSKAIESGPATAMEIDQRGSGTEDDPYRLFINQITGSRACVFQTTSNTYAIDGNSIVLTEKVRVSFPIKFINTTSMYITIYLMDPSQIGDEDDAIIAYWGQTDTGEWVWIRRDLGGYQPHGISSLYPIERSGEKQSVNFSLETASLNSTGYYYENGELTMRGTAIRIKLFDADGSILDDQTTPGAEIGEIKVSTGGDESTGVVMKYNKDVDYSKKENIEDAKLIDSQSVIANGVMNGVFPVGDWSSDYQPDGRLQQALLYSYLNVYGKPYRIFEANIYDNDILFQQVLINVLEQSDLYIQVYDEYNVRKCVHNVQLLEINHGVFDDQDVLKIEKEKLVND